MRSCCEQSFCPLLDEVSVDGRSVDACVERLEDLAERLLVTGCGLELGEDLAQSAVDLGFGEQGRDERLEDVRLLALLLSEVLARGLLELGCGVDLGMAASACAAAQSGGGKRRTRRVTALRGIETTDPAGSGCA